MDYARTSGGDRWGLNNTTSPFKSVLQLRECQLASGPCGRQSESSRLTLESGFRCTVHLGGRVSSPRSCRVICWPAIPSHVGRQALMVATGVPTSGGHCGNGWGKCRTSWGSVRPDAQQGAGRSARQIGSRRSAWRRLCSPRPRCCAPSRRRRSGL